MLPLLMVTFDTIFIAVGITLGIPRVIMLWVTVSVPLHHMNQPMVVISLTDQWKELELAKNQSPQSSLIQFLMLLSGNRKMDCSRWTICTYRCEELHGLSDGGRGVCLLFWRSIPILDATEWQAWKSLAMDLGWRWDKLVPMIVAIRVINIREWCYHLAFIGQIKFNPKSNDGTQ